MNEQYDIDEPVEVRIRGDAIDVFGALMALLAPAVEDGTENERADDVIRDIADEMNKRVNLGHWKREATRTVNSGDLPEYRGIQLLVDAFDPRHPEPAGASVDQLSPLDEAEWYMVFQRSDEGFEAAGYPESTGVETRMLMASFLRQYARDLEEPLTEAPEEP